MAKKKKKILTVIGARPQFIKHAPVELAIQEYFDLTVVHTGQHYDQKMSKVFFDELKLGRPDYMLNVGSHSHGKQTALMIIDLEAIVQENDIDAILIYGDTNSTLAGALVGSKLQIPIIHIEAGLRSFNREMPEEINRVLTDHVSSILFAPTPLAVENLRKENITEHVYMVGDVMCDMIQIAKKSKVKIVQENFYLLTLHRPYNVDNGDRLLQLLAHFNQLDLPIKFPIHPRTRNKLKSMQVDLEGYNRIQFLEPQSYFDLIQLMVQSRCVITDSGGIQKEAYLLEKKCITIRKETEWKETLEGGWNSLFFDDLEGVQDAINRDITAKHKPEIYGDGKAAKKIAQVLIQYFEVYAQKAHLLSNL